MKRILLCMSFILWLMVGYSDGQLNVAKTFVVKSLRIVLPKNSGPVMQNIASVFTRRIEDRCGAKVSTIGDAEMKVELVIELGIGTEGFRITDGKNGSIRIIGNDQRGVLYGVGKFLRTSTYSKDGFTAGKWRGTSFPEKPVRGMYLATHLYNFYQAAPVEEVERYIEDIALWGVNTIMVWYDMHHFKGFDDPEAVAFRDRLKQFMQTAQKLDMGVGFMMIGNEGYANSPVNLQVIPGGSRGGNYPEVICPNKPGGMEYILKTKEEFFEWCQGINPEYMCIWPYDQGGCGSADCQPWGSNGFIKCAKSISKIAREKLPGIKVILSTWFFDSTEWHGLSDKLAMDHSWLDMIMAEGAGFENSKFPPLAGNLPMVGFPEISMYGTFPWGGFGATPFPKHLQGQWQKVQKRLSGGFPYSEGIYEDINKVTYAQLYWNSQIPLEDILNEYIAYEYGSSTETGSDILKVITTLEQNHHMRWWPGLLEGIKLTLDWLPSKGVKPQADPGAEEAYATVKTVDAQLPEWARKSWRWRILYIRTMLDAELKANGGTPNEACMKGFKELMKIYHTTEKTDPVVKPPIPGTGE